MLVTGATVNSPPFSCGEKDGRVGASGETSQGI